MISKIKRSKLSRGAPVQPKLFRGKLNISRNDDHWLDIWLSRVSHFSQFGLFVITLGSLYFVVLPIYQKTVLDEAIARKEIELKESEKLVEQSYVQLRKFALTTFTRVVFSKCVINFQDAEVTKDNFESVYSLNNDVSSCLLESGKSSKNIMLLRPNDQAIFLAELINITAEIEQNRTVSLKQYIELPEKAKSDPSLLRPPKYFEGRMMKNFEELASVLHLKPGNSRFTAGVHAAQLDVYSAHMDFAKKKLDSLIDLNWSNSKINISECLS